ncbi:unnamed protein product [Symbiodinium natans]|uniref:Uncharacterized protein n=1 Tax=Symbiodinium natans TaxID=878477 RepID=A0A812IK92_9DINO|nr:unnamed protein product [Symbiodinium natans]
MLQVQRLEELAAEGRKAAKKNEVREGASGVGIGWAKVLREAKVRASKSKGSEVVGNLHEGARVLVEEVSSKAARIHLPFAGWITLAKASGPVLEQDSCNRRGSGEKSATQWVMEHTLARLRPADGHIGERVSMPSEMPVHPPECPEPADQGAMDTTSKFVAQLPSVGTWLAATPPVSALVANASMAQRLAAFAQPHSVAHTEPPLAQSVRPACAFSHLPSVATWSMPSEMPVHPPECPEPADQGAMDTTSKLFAQLPSVGTWLAATPPVSALAAIDEGFPNPRVAPTNPLFVQLPSVGTWLAPAQAAFAQPHSVAHTEPPLAQYVRPASAFTHLPSVATWLAAKPAQVAAEVSDPAEPTRQPSPGSTPTGVWWLAFCNSLQQTLCCGRGK